MSNSCLFTSQCNCMLGNFGCFVVVCFFLFSKKLPFPKPFKNTIRVSNCLDTDQAQHFFGPDLGPSSLQHLSTDNTSRQRVNIVVVIISMALQAKKNTAWIRAVIDWSFGVSIYW